MSLRHFIDLGSSNSHLRWSVKMSSCSFVVFSANPPVVFVIYRKKHVWPFSHALLFHKRRLKIGGKVRYLLSEMLQKVSNIIMIFLVTAKGWQMKGSESRGWCGLILGGDQCYGNWLSCGHKLSALRSDMTHVFCEVFVHIHQTSYDSLKLFNRRHG